LEEWTEVHAGSRLYTRSQQIWEIAVSTASDHNIYNKGGMRMKWLLIITFVMQSVAAQSLTPNPPDISEPSNVEYALNQAQGFMVSTDKQLHMAGCFMISSITTSLVYNRTADKRKAVLIGFGAGMVAGIAKEVYDIRYGNPDWADILADGIGSGLGAVSITFTF
jgi:VanZ family protein